SQPTSSLREVAAAVGASPETVRTVKRARNQHDIPSSAHEDRRAATEWQQDAAILGMEGGRQFLVWFDRTAPGLDWEAYVAKVPLGRVYAVADEARRRADTWRVFAELLEQRSQPSLHP